MIKQRRPASSLLLAIIVCVSLSNLAVVSLQSRSAQAIGYPYSTFIVAENKGDAILFADPNQTGRTILGKYKIGTQLVVYDDSDSVWCEVSIGSNVHGYIKKDLLSNLRYELTSDGTMHTLGYLVSNIEDFSKNANAIYSEPSIDSAILTEGLDRENGITVEVLGVLDGWFQIRFSSRDAEIGFVRTMNWNPFMLTNILVTETHIPFDVSEFRIGIDIPEGLYVFSPDSAMGDGVIEIHSKTDFVSKKISYLGVYTMYLRNGEIFRILNGGNLKPLVIDNIAGTKESRDGRYFVGGQIKGNEVYYFTKYDVTKPAYYRVDNLSTDTCNSALQWHEILRSDPIELVLHNGEFIEIVNCEVTLVPSSG